MPILNSEIQLFKSSSGVGLGGAISNTEIVSGELNNLFDDVSSNESILGDTEYRCFYIKNSNAAIDYLNALIYITSQTTSPDTNIEIGLGTAGANNTEQTVPNEETAPSGVVFGLAPDEAGAVILGNIAANGGYISVWIKRTVNAGAGATSSDLSTVRVKGETAA